MEVNLIPDISPAVLQAIPMLIDFPKQRFWVDYDREADVLYISFQHPQKATNTIMRDDGLLLRYREGQLVGITILDASARTPPVA
ncbi:MAG: DUF2283 domain-containing protein [Caldilineaceae bacterium]